LPKSGSDDAAARPDICGDRQWRRDAADTNSKSMRMFRGLSVVVVMLAGCGGGVAETSGAGRANDTGNGGQDAGASADAETGASSDPFAAAPTCTSGTTWTQGNHGSPEMNPGRACIACHSTMDGPGLTIAGTVYQTAHEPDLCDGADGANGVRVVITGADGQTTTLTPVPSGNFHLRTPVMMPFTAKVTFMGRERAMTAAQMSGDCNGCHTQSGANDAPGRILLP
jgi:hypothetical protein